MSSDEIQILTFRDLIAGYRRRADVLRQIHGRKASLGRKQEAAYLIVTVLLATVLTVIGFAGGARIASIIPSDWLAPAKAAGFVESVMNVLVLVVLILTLIGLIYRYGERANLHFRSVEILTEFIRDLDDSIALHDSEVRLFKDTDVDIVRTRYKGLLGALPPNTDREYLKARDHARKKREKARRGASVDPRAGVVLAPTGGSLHDIARARKIGRVLSKDAARMVVLGVVSDVLPSKGWVVGGFVREAVWDDLEGAALPAPVGEVDVVYYDAADTSRAAEAALRSQLSTKARNIEWSVKNQARMHEVNGHEPYGGVEDAIKRAPETASSVAVRLSAKRIHILAPLGLKDLVKGILRPNPNASVEAFEARLDRLYKTDRWPNLKLERPASKETAGQE